MQMSNGKSHQQANRVTKLVWLSENGRGMTWMVVTITRLKLFKIMIQIGSDNYETINEVNMHVFCDLILVKVKVQIGLG